jgi:hypothetical protein
VFYSCGECFDTLSLGINFFFMRNNVTITIFFILFSAYLQAQTLGITLEGIGDNREYFSGYNKPETIIGSRITIDFGTIVHDIHQVKAGLSYFYEYGSEVFALKPDIVLYYEVQKNALAFRMGAVPRREVLNYPLAIFSDVYGYYNPTIDGLQFQYKKTNSMVNAWVDWISRQDSVKREQFMAGFNGATRLGNFLIEDYWYMFHNAGREPRLPGEHIEDAMGGLICLGYDFSSLLPIDVITVKTGILNSMWRNRGNGLAFEVQNSSYTELHAEHKGYGIQATYNVGNKHHFTHGDSFYNNTNSYLRCNFYFTPINFEKVKGRFTWSLHLADGDLDNQQQFSLIYFFDIPLAVKGL